MRCSRGFCCCVCCVFVESVPEDGGTAPHKESADPTDAAESSDLALLLVKRVARPPAPHSVSRARAAARRRSSPASLLKGGICHGGLSVICHGAYISIHHLAPAGRLRGRVGAGACARCGRQPNTFPRITSRLRVRTARVLAVWTAAIYHTSPYVSQCVLPRACGCAQRTTTSLSGGTFPGGAKAAAAVRAALTTAPGRCK